VLDATAAITVEHGWGAVTMAKVAGLAGVSRQTVYNEYGVKPALGQAMVLRELDRFLAVVAHELDTGDDLVSSIRAAAEQTLLMARENPLLHTVLTSAHSVSSGGSQADTELLPFLTTDAGPLIAAAKGVIMERLGRFPDLGFDRDQLDVATDAIVRLVLSQVMQPGGDPRRTADQLAWIAGRLLGRP
jgi:AcrR family transcriptional regulator